MGQVAREGGGVQMAFMIAQRAFIKVYLITMVERQARIWISDAGRTAARIQEPWVLTAAKRNLPGSA